MVAQFVPLQAGSSFPIPMQQPILLVGRHPESDIRIDSPMISRRHCCLAVVNNRVLVRDLGSRHGVHLNGVRVDEAEVNQGDQIAIGHLLYRFEADSSSGKPRPVVSSPPAPSSTEPDEVDLPMLRSFDDELVPIDD